MKWNLRDYQKRFCRGITDALEGKTEGGPFTRVLGCAATGAGKTVMAAALTEYWVNHHSGRVAFLADSDELCDQAVKTIFRSTGTAKHPAIIPDLEKAKSRASDRAPCVVGCIQSVQARLDRIPANRFTHVFADEAHMSMAKGWQDTLKHFAGGGARIIGITATPERGDKKSLMRFYEHIAAEIPLKELIDRRHLSPIVVETVPLEIRITSKVGDGDGDNDELAAELEAYFNAIIDAIEKHAPDRKRFLIFHASVGASKAFNELLLKRGHSSAHVDGGSSNRTQIIEAYNRGDYRFLNNCQLLTKGFDSPAVDCVLILRPVRSRTNYVQMAGRGTRLFCPHGCVEWCSHSDRKMDMLLLDFLWEFESHDVMGPADILTDNPDQKKALAKKLKEGGILDLMEEDKAIIGQREMDLLEKLKKQMNRRGSKVDARAMAALLHQPDLMDYEPMAQWQHQAPTMAQLSALANTGVDPDTVLDRGHAAALMSAYTAQREAGRATLKQVAILAGAGVPNAGLISFRDASRMIDDIFAARR